MASHTLTLELYYSGAWRSAPVYVRDGCKLKRGTASPGSDSEPASATLTLDNRLGLYSPRSVASPLYGLIGQNTKARLTIDGSVRLTGEVVSWVPERAIKGDAWTRIEIAGVLQRIGRGTDPLASPAQRSILSLGAAAYYPLTDGGNATTAADLIGSAALTAQGALSFASVAGPGAGDTSHPEFLGSSGFIGGLTGALPAATTSEWTVEFWFRAVASASNATGVLASWRTTGGTYGATFWVAHIAKVGGTHHVYLAAQHDGSTATGFSYNGGSTIDGAWHQVRVTATQVTATQIHVEFYVDDVLRDQTTASTWTVGDLASITLGDYAADVGWLYPTASVEALSVAHLAVWSDSTPASTYQAGAGYDQETAADRFVRVSGEENITATVVGDPAESVAMGPQRCITLLDLYDEIARTDDASIFETRDDIGLTMRTGVSKLNQAPALTISYLGQVRPPLAPVVGDEGIRNDVTAAAPSGGSRRVQQLTGPHNIELPEDDPQGVGRYSTRIEVNPATDGALGDAAGWRVHLGTFAGTWYAAITADLDAAPSIATAAAALDIGDLVALTNLPVDEALGTVESIVIGIEEDIQPRRRLLTFFCVPAEPYRVGVLAATTGDTDPLVGRLDTDGSTTVAAVAASEFFWDGFEAGAAAWGALNGWTVASSTAFARSGSTSMRITPPGAVATGGAILTGRTPATAGRTYIVEVWFYSVAGWADARAAVDWRNAADAVISSSLGSATVVPPGVWTVSRQVFTAPALTVSAQPRARQGGTPTAADVLWVDDVSFTPQLSVATPSGPLWTTTADDFPLDLIIGGQVVTISAITGAASPQTFTVATGEPPAYSIPAGSAVNVAQPIILTM